MFLPELEGISNVNRFLYFNMTEMEPPIKQIRNTLKIDRCQQQRFPPCTTFSPSTFSLPLSSIFTGFASFLIFIRVSSGAVFG